MPADGLITLQSSLGFEQTMKNFEAAIKAKGMTVFAQIDHAVVHVSSNAARYPQPNGAPYAAAKAALNAYSKSLAHACGPHGVRWPRRCLP